VELLVPSMTIDCSSRRRYDAARHERLSLGARNMSGSKRWHRRLIWILVVLIFLGGAGLWAFLRVGTWLVVEDPLVQAPVAVVLSAAMPIRAREAAEIFRQGNATEVWITHGSEPTEELHELGIDYLGEAFYNQRVLIQLGVPGEATRVLEPAIVNTEDEIQLIARLAREQGIHRIIIVTSKAHTRRVHTLWRKLVGSDPQLIVRYAREDPFDGAHWWRRTHDALDVVREVLGLANAWAGFPIKHRAD
jgi:uncharacterized SAM-binding protein YcdF (DUF218 family)